MAGCHLSCRHPTCWPRFQVSTTFRPNSASKTSATSRGASLDFADLYELVAAINEALNDGCVGPVVTQGTDTIEEVAYALDLLLPTDAPVVVTGAMHNPTMAGADGPANILAAIRVATSPCARGLGCLVVLNDQVHAASWVQKAHTSSPNAFVSPDPGPLGHVIEGRVHIPVRIRRSLALSPHAVADFICSGQLAEHAHLAANHQQAPQALRS